jgi:hypothetical protein
MNPTVIEMTKAALGSNRSISRTIAPGFARAGLSVAILSGWFVVTRVGFRHALNVWDVTALRFGERGHSADPDAVGWSVAPAGARMDSRDCTRQSVRRAFHSARRCRASAHICDTGDFRGSDWMGDARRTATQAAISGYILIAAGLSVLIYGYALTEGRQNAAGVLTLIVAAAMWAAYTLRLRRSGLTPLQLRH